MSSTPEVESETPASSHPGPPLSTGSADAPQTPNGPDPMEELLAALAASQAEASTREQQLRACQTAYRQAISDFDRERERTARDRDKALDRDRMALAGRLLDVLDNLDRSLIGAPQEGPGANIATGVRMVQRQFVEALEEFGVQRMAVLGVKFDANLHEAAGLMPASAGVPDQHIAHEAQAGYLFKGQLLRAARVIVAQSAD